MVFHDLPRPFAKLYRTGIVDLKSNSNDHLKRVMLQFSVDLPSPLGLNYPEIPDSCLLRQFVVVIYFLNVLINCANVHIVKRRYHLLCQPNVFVLITHLKTFVTVAGGGHKSQIFRSRTAKRQFFFLEFLSILLPSPFYLLTSTRRSFPHFKTYRKLRRSSHQQTILRPNDALCLFDNPVLELYSIPNGQLFLYPDILFHVAIIWLPLCRNRK